ncbi:MAG: YceD family protein [Pseudomonadota bacterium]|nr:YceD family protein [Pseudomonadota bacterium]
MKELSEFSNILLAEALGEAAKFVRLEANAVERAALAGRFELVSIESLVGDLIIERIKGSELIRVCGRMSAEIQQFCVISGETVSGNLVESVDERFGPSDETGIEIAFEEENTPEPIIDGRIDLAEIIAQYLGVAIDPYPRAPGAKIMQQYQDEEEEMLETRKNPFGVLSSLQRE